MLRKPASDDHIVLYIMPRRKIYANPVGGRGVVDELVERVDFIDLYRSPSHLSSIVFHPWRFIEICCCEMCCPAGLDWDRLDLIEQICEKHDFYVL